MDPIAMLVGALLFFLGFIAGAIFIVMAAAARRGDLGD